VLGTIVHCTLEKALYSEIKCPIGKGHFYVRQIKCSSKNGILGANGACSKCPECKECNDLWTLYIAEVDQTVRELKLPPDNAKVFTDFMRYYNYKVLDILARIGYDKRTDKLYIAEHGRHDGEHYVGLREYIVEKCSERGGVVCVN
jgi:phage FluMu protein Com